MDGENFMKNNNICIHEEKILSLSVKTGGGGGLKNVIFLDGSPKPIW